MTTPDPRAFTVRCWDARRRWNTGPEHCWMCNGTGVVCCPCGPYRIIMYPCPCKDVRHAR